LTSNLPNVALNKDAVLQNAWGIAFNPSANGGKGSPFWIADNATGCATLYDGAGVPQSLRVGIPLPGGSVPMTACNPVTATTKPIPAAPTGVVFNSTPAFLAGSEPALFIFDTEDGTISAWASGTAAVLEVDESNVTPLSAVFKGLTFGTNGSDTLLYATNFRAATVEVFAPGSTGYQRVNLGDGAFVDPKIPAGYAPFGIHTIGGALFVTYALQNAEKHDDVAGQGHGFVDIWGTDGHLIQRFAQRGQLNSPWGVVRASMAFAIFRASSSSVTSGTGRSMPSTTVEISWALSEMRATSHWLLTVCGH
jgi:uncharacterized protein (TIGR03118 family)